MTPIATSKRRPRLPVWLATAALVLWLASLASVIALAGRPASSAGSDALPEVLPRLGSQQLQLPYFSFARALRPGS